MRTLEGVRMRPTVGEPGKVKSDLAGAHTSAEVGFVGRGRGGRDPLEGFCPGGSVLVGGQGGFEFVYGLLVGEFAAAGAAERFLLVVGASGEPLGLEVERVDQTVREGLAVFCE